MGLFKRIMRKLVPDIQVVVKSIDLQARLEVDLDQGNKCMCRFLFLERPHLLEWDLKISLTKAEIPLLGEDRLDAIVTKNELERIGKDKPIRVKY
jgi:hypothetical protein